MIDDMILVKLPYDGTSGSAARILAALVDKDIGFDDFSYSVEHDLLEISFHCFSEDVQLNEGDVLYIYKNGTMRICRLLWPMREE